MNASLRDMIHAKAKLTVDIWFDVTMPEMKAKKLTINLKRAASTQMIELLKLQTQILVRALRLTLLGPKDTFQRMILFAGMRP